MKLLPHQIEGIAELMDEAAQNLRLVMDTAEAELGRFRHFLPDELEGSALMLRDSLSEDDEL